MSVMQCRERHIHSPRPINSGICEEYVIGYAAAEIGRIEYLSNISVVTREELRLVYHRHQPKLGHTVLVC